MFLAGIGLLFWAVASLRLRNLQAAPEVKKGAVMVSNGPYRFVRHPMYTSGLLICLLWVIGDFTWLRLAAWIVLLTDLLAKMRYEESLLLKAYPDYEEYQHKTRRLLPFIY